MYYLCQDFNKMLLSLMFDSIKKDTKLNVQIKRPSVDKSLKNAICYEHLRDFKHGNANNTMVQHNLQTNHKFDIKNSNILAYIHNRNKRRIFESCVILSHNTISGFFKISPFIAKPILNKWIQENGWSTKK